MMLGSAHDLIARCFEQDAAFGFGDYATHRERAVRVHGDRADSNHK
jgi:hypothetical protein